MRERARTTLGELLEVRASVLHALLRANGPPRPVGHELGDEQPHSNQAVLHHDHDQQPAARVTLALHDAHPVRDDGHRVGRAPQDEHIRDDRQIRHHLEEEAPVPQPLRARVHGPARELDQLPRVRLPLDHVVHEGEQRCRREGDRKQRDVPELHDHLAHLVHRASILGQVALAVEPLDERHVERVLDVPLLDGRDAPAAHGDRAVAQPVHHVLKGVDRPELQGGEIGEVLRLRVVRVARCLRRGRAVSWRSPRRAPVWRALPPLRAARGAVGPVHRAVQRAAAPRQAPRYRWLAGGGCIARFDEAAPQRLLCNDWQRLRLYARCLEALAHALAVAQPQPAENARRNQRLEMARE
mmetsp:Transcript_7081/g.18142  ORF Transcript_7081/g.18142 Transcript_7081/m.18142 type:complete len:355 (-) Transcript_7081:176-1240(-)